MAAITARDFNQHTGHAKLLAQQEPVFITERGKVKYVLLNIDEYNELRGISRSLIDLSSEDSKVHYASDFDDFIPSRSSWNDREVDLL